jgi:hypothetical protein
MGSARGGKWRRSRPRFAGGIAAWNAAGALALGTPFAATAQAPDLVVPWTLAPIAIDGDSEAAWAAAETFFIGEDVFSIAFRALHDGRTLYVQVFDLSDDTHEPGAGAAIAFDDEGGVPPLLGDGGWTASACSPFANRGEGFLGWFLTSQSPIAVEERWTEMTSGPTCPTVIGQNGSSAAIWFEPSPVTGLITEVALPIEGSSALEVAAGERFGLHVDAYYAALGQTYRVGYWPGVFGPYYGDVALAALACNGPAEEVDPRFPADWVNAATGGPGWLRSGAGGCGVANATGAVGESACLLRGASTSQLVASFVSPWFSLLGQSSAALTYRAVYVDAPASSNRLDLEARTASAGWAPLLSWTTTHGNPGGEAVNVDLSGFANEPRVQLRWRYSVGKGDAGFGAQVDQVRLRCSPSLFSDTFESGLTTHWSAESP